MMGKGDMDTLMQEVIQSSIPWHAFTCIGNKCRMLYQRSPKWRHFFDQLLENIVLPTEEHLMINSLFIELVVDRIMRG